MKLYCLGKIEDFQGRGRCSPPWSSSSDRVVTPFLDSDLFLCSFMADQQENCVDKQSLTAKVPSRGCQAPTKEQRYFHTHLSLESVYN